jgi:hypothetical protein
LWATLFGVGWGFQLQLVGVLYVGEIVALIYFATVRQTDPSWLRREKNQYIAIYLLILLGLIVSDIYNGSNSRDYLRSWFSIIMGAISLLFVINILRHDSRSSIYLLISLAMGLAILKLSNNSLQSLGDSNFFKAEIAPILLLVIASIAVWKRKRGLKLKTSSIFLFGLFFFALGARSAGLMLMLASFSVGALAIPKKYTIHTLFFIIPAVSVFGYMGYYFYVANVLSGEGGTNSFDQLRRAANPYNPFELLYQGRLDVFVAFQANIERPIMGYGSWAADTNGYFAKLGAQLAGISAIDSIGSPEFIRGHSFILTAWLWGGAIGLLGAILLGIKIIASFSRTRLKKSDILYDATIILLFGFFWNYVFSPFGHIRTSFPLAIGMLVVLLGDSKSNGFRKSVI